MEPIKSIIMVAIKISLLGVLALLAACTDETPPKPEHPPLRITWEYWPGYYPMAIAVELKLFEKHGIEVEPLLYENSIEASSDFVARKVDGTLKVPVHLIPVASETPLKAVMVVDNSAGADQVVARADITTVSDLRGKRIGHTPGDLGELLVVEMLRQHGLTLQDVTSVRIDSEEVPEALDAGLIDVGVTWEPFSSQAVAAGHHVIFTSAETPGLIIDVAVFHASVVEQRPEDIRAFIKAWFEAVDYWKNNPAEAAQMIAKQTGFKPGDISAEGVKIFNLQDNLAAFKKSQDFSSVYTTAQAYVDLFIGNGTLKAVPDLDAFFDPSFLTE